MSDWLKQRKKKAPKRAEVIVVHSLEGGGKTSFAAQFPGANFLMSANETGLHTLTSKKLIPECNYFPEFRLWNDVLDLTEEMIAAPDKLRPRSIVVDTVNGIETLLHRHVCERDYGGNMTKNGFLSYKEGYLASMPDWRAWLDRLDKLRNLGTTIVLLCHTKIEKYNNPEGPDYHRFVAEVEAPTWGATRKFADLVVFLNFATEVSDVTGGENKKKTGKGKGGLTRVYHFDRMAAFDAKQRHGLPTKFVGTGSAAGDFKEFVKLCKASTPKPEPKPAPVETAAEEQKEVNSPDSESSS